MKTTVEIPDDLYRQAKVQAAHENRKVKDLVSEGLRLVLGLTKKSPSKGTQRMTKAPVAIRPGNVIPPLAGNEGSEASQRHEESRRKAMAAMEEIRRHPLPPQRVKELMGEMTRLRKEGWDRGDSRE